MLLRDLFDTNPDLKSKLVTATLGGMAYVYTDPTNLNRGWWENIPLCAQVNECECVHNWVSFKETQDIPSPNPALPAFNQVLVDSGLVYQKIDTTTNWFVQDSLVYGPSTSPLRYYIAPDNLHNLSPSTDFIAFDSLYLARFSRTSSLKSVLAIDYINDSLDLRPNELLATESHPNFNNWGFHQKDYHIYLWALMNQIDAKLNECSTTTSVEQPINSEGRISIYPNPNNGHFTVEIDGPISTGEQFLITDILGNVVKIVDCKSINQIRLEGSHIYILKSNKGTKKIIVN